MAVPQPRKQSIAVEIEDFERILNLLLTTLRDTPDVVAVGSYGSTATRTWSTYSDIDLVAVTSSDPVIESVHFFVDGIPVDLNLRLPDDSAHGIAGSSFMPETVPLFDPDRILANAVVGRSGSGGAENESRLMKYLLRHSINKTQKLTHDECKRFISDDSKYFFLAFCLTHNEPFEDVDQAIGLLNSMGSEIPELLNRAISRPNDARKHLIQAADLALEPIGGLWKIGEIMPWSWPGSNQGGEEFCCHNLSAIVDVSDPPRTFI